MRQSVCLILVALVGIISTIHADVVPDGEYEGMYTVALDQMGSHMIEYIKGPFPYWIDADPNNPEYLKIKEQILSMNKTASGVDSEFCRGCYDYCCGYGPSPSRRCDECKYRYKYDCSRRDRGKKKDKFECEMVCTPIKDRDWDSGTYDDPYNRW